MISVMWKSFMLRVIILNVIMLSVTYKPFLLSVIYDVCHYVECHYAECRHAEWYYAECRGTVCFAFTKSKKKIKEKQQQILAFTTDK
jgi:hypothetical protein